MRRQTHQRIVQVLEAQFPETAATQPELLAYHALRGELWDQALTYFRQAGEQAVARSAYREAVAAFEQALGAVQHLPESRDTLAQAIDLRLALRNALYPLGELGGSSSTCRKPKPSPRPWATHTGWGGSLSICSPILRQVCEPDRALTSGQRALAIATALGDVGLTVTAQHYLGSSTAAWGTIARRWSATKRTWRVSTARCSRSASVCLGWLLLPPAVTSSPLLPSAAPSPRGGRPAEEGVQLAEAADHPYSRVMAYWGVGFRALRQGDLPQAIPVLERALDLAQGAHLRLLVPWVAASLGAAYALAGRTADALPLLEQAVAQAVAMQFLLDHALWMVWLGEAYLCAGRPDEACTQAQRALEFSRAHQERGHAAYALRLLGEIRGPPRSAGGRAGCRPLPPGPRPGRGAGHAPACGPLPPRPRDVVCRDRPARAGPDCAVDGYRNVPRSWR